MSKLELADPGRRLAQVQPWTRGINTLIRFAPALKADSARTFSSGTAQEHVEYPVLSRKNNSGICWKIACRDHALCFERPRRYRCVFIATAMNNDQQSDSSLCEWNIAKCKASHFPADKREWPCVSKWSRILSSILNLASRIFRKASWHSTSYSEASPLQVTAHDGAASA